MNLFHREGPESKRDKPNPSGERTNVPRHPDGCLNISTCGLTLVVGIHGPSVIFVLSPHLSMIRGFPIVIAIDKPFEVWYGSACYEGV